jgi:hypothetical protein
MSKSGHSAGCLNLEAGPQVTSVLSGADNATTLC